VRSQLLERPGRTRSPEAIVRHLCGAQAQLPSATALALRARGTGFTLADVDRARFSERSLVRTWCMRGTLHLVAVEDLGWLHGLLAPYQVPAAVRRLAQLGIGEDDAARAVELVAGLLESDGALRRDEMAERLRGRGIPTEGQAGIHLARLAVLEGVAALDADARGEERFVAFRELVPERSALPEDAALAELARRHLAAHAPAEPRDLAAWSGIGSRRARRAWKLIAREIVETRAAPGTWHLRSQRLEGGGAEVCLAPAFDPYLLGYRERGFALSPEHAPHVNAGGGWVRPLLIVGGRVQGTWGSERRGGALRFTVEPFAPLRSGVEGALGEEAADVARFLGLDSHVTLSAPLGPPG